MLTRVLSRLKSVESQMWALRRRNAVLAAAQENRTCKVGSIASPPMLSKQVSVLDKFCARWQLDDLPELFLRLLQRLKAPGAKEC